MGNIVEKRLQSPMGSEGEGFQSRIHQTFFFCRPSHVSQVTVRSLGHVLFHGSIEQKKKKVAGRMHFITCFRCLTCARVRTARARANVDMV